MSGPLPPTDDEIAQAIEALLGARAPGASICPSDAARYLRADEWRPLLPAVRRVAATLARAGLLRITQGAGEVSPQQIDAGTVRGPIRLRRPAGPATAAVQSARREVVLAAARTRTTPPAGPGEHAQAPQRPSRHARPDGTKRT